MLTSKANQIYTEFLVKNTILPDEFFPFLQFNDRLVFREEEKRFKEMNPETLELPFTKEPSKPSPFTILKPFVPH